MKPMVFLHHKTVLHCPIFQDWSGLIKKTNKQSKQTKAQTVGNSQALNTQSGSAYFQRVLWTQKTVIQHLKKTPKCWFFALTTPLSEKVLPYIHIWSYLGNCVFDLADVWLDVDHFGLVGVRCLQFSAADLRRIWPDLGQLRCVPRTFGMAQFCGVWFQFFFGIELYWIGLVALDFGSFGLSWPHFVCFRLGLGICSTFKFWILTFLMEGCRVGN